MRFPASTTAALHCNVVHRAACLALYRRLLKHTQNAGLILPSPAPPTSGNPPPPPPPPPSQLRQSLKSIITREFKKYSTRDIALPTLRAALTLGYKAEKSLRLATAVPSDPIELARISAFLTLHRHRRGEQKPLKRLQSANITVQPTPKPQVPKPINPNILLLPPDLRFKPTIIGGNTIPFVRYTGTRQSPELSGILNKKLKQKLKRDNLLETLRLEREYAIVEDVFENELWNEAGKDWRRENPGENPAKDGHWKTEVSRALMELQVKMWAHQVSVWERSGQCMEKIEEHKRRVKEFMKKIKAEKLREKQKVEGTVEAVEGNQDLSEVNTQIYASNVQSKATGLRPELRPVEPTKKLRTEGTSDFNGMDAQMDALNAQLEAAGLQPDPRAAKPKRPSRNSFEVNDYSRKKANTRPEYYPRSRPSQEPKSWHSPEPKSRLWLEPRPRPGQESRPRPKRTPSPKRHEEENEERLDRREDRRDQSFTQQRDNGAMLAGKGKRARSIGLNMAKVFGSEEPGPRASRSKAQPAAESENKSFRENSVAIDDELRTILGR